MRRRFLFLLVALGLLVAVGCSLDTGDVTTKMFADEGQLCLRSTQTDSASERLLVTVVFPTCLSSSCDTPTAMQCAVELQGDRIKVTSSASVQTRGDQCTADCGFLHTQCRSNPIPAGRYTLQHGEDEASIELPTPPTELGGPGPVPCSDL